MKENGISLYDKKLYNILTNKWILWNVCIRLVKIPLRPYSEKKFEVYYFRGEWRTSSKCPIYFGIGPQSIVVAQWVKSLDLTTHTSLSPIQRGFEPGFVHYKKGCTLLAAGSDQVYQLLAHGRWFSPGIPASSTTKTGCHDIAEILLKVALKHQNSKINQSYSIVSRRKTAKTNHRMKPYSKCLQKGNDHDRKTLPLHDM